MKKKPSKSKKPIYHYVIMRNDIPSLNPGKAMAHANHAGTQMSYWVRKHGSKYAKKLFSTWENGAKGAGTCIVLAGDEETMKIAVQNAKKKNLVSGIWHDPTYPAYNDMGEGALIPMDVCAWFLGYKEDFIGILDHLSLTE